ncbi:MAG TPA: hypothetical protein GX531_07270, partial [Methanothermobacter sp.]|nr:hypothetical protein [Methanothermobacter sp.]
FISTGTSSIMILAFSRSVPSAKTSNRNFNCSGLMDVLAEGTLLENAKIIIEDVPVEINCRKCQYTGLANTDGSDHYLAIVLCPQCGGRDVETLTGKECSVKNIKIEKSDEDA